MTSTVAIGQRVHSILYGGRDGIVFRIQGEQMPHTVQQFAGGGVVMGGRAYFDIVFDNGSISRSLPESILHGVQWRIYDSIATADEIAAALHHAEHEEARRTTDKQQAEGRRAAERVKHAADNPHLLKKSDRPDWSPGRLAAENIRRELKRAFPGVKFKVRSDFNCVDIYWTDGPTSKQVKAITDKYKAGTFDGMTDCYEYDPDATFSDVFGDPRYVFGHREESIDGLRRAWVGSKYQGKAEDVPEDWKQAGGWNLGILRERVMEAWSETDLR